MDILLVEDDDFKAADIEKVLDEVQPSAHVERATSVTAALRSITGKRYALVVLDMSLPTFALSGPGGGGSPQSQGGLEVLRLARRLGNAATYIVVTQYPDIELDNREIPLNDAPKALSSRFGIDVKACLLYRFDGDEWRQPLRDCTKAVRDAIGASV